MTRRLTTRLVLAAIFATLMGTHADARHPLDTKHDLIQGQSSTMWVRVTLTKKNVRQPARKVRANRPHSVRHPTGVQRAEQVQWGAAQVLPHPQGCPPRAFCGCGVSLRLLGKAVQRGGLAIAANWGGFPRTSCAPGMAAYRPGHVYAIEQCLPGNKALAYDPNSGGRKTRLHVRPLAGYQIVNPHGAYTEVNGKPGRAYRSHRYAKRYKRTRYATAG